MNNNEYTYDQDEHDILMNICVYHGVFAWTSNYDQDESDFLKWCYDLGYSIDFLISPKANWEKLLESWSKEQDLDTVMS